MHFDLVPINKYTNNSSWVCLTEMWFSADMISWLSCHDIYWCVFRALGAISELLERGLLLVRYCIPLKMFFRKLTSWQVTEVMLAICVHDFQVFVQKCIVVILPVCCQHEFRTDMFVSFVCDSAARDSFEMREIKLLWTRRNMTVIFHWHLERHICVVSYLCAEACLPFPFTELLSCNLSPRSSHKDFKDHESCKLSHVSLLNKWCLIMFSASCLYQDLVCVSSDA